MNKGSQKFIEYAVGKISDGYTYHEMFRKTHALLLEYERKDPHRIQKMLIDKLTKAAEEYGDPMDNKGKYNVTKELEMEIMDLVFGWPLIRSYLDDAKKT